MDLLSFFLGECLQEYYLTVHQPWYADNLCMACTTSDINAAMQDLKRWGPLQGYFPFPEKSVAIVQHLTQMHAVKAQLQSYGFKYTTRARYLGSYIGNLCNKQLWLDSQIKQWVKDIKLMSHLAKHHPQAILHWCDPVTTG